MNIVTGYRGEPHVTSWQDRDLNQGVFGPNTYILDVGSKLEATVVTNNEIRIADGVVMMQGCQGVIQKGTYDTIAIDNGSQGLKRIDLICVQYQKSGGVESMSLVVIKGTPAASNPSDPSYTSGDIQSGDNLVQEPLYRVNINGLTIESIDGLCNTVNALWGGDYAHSFSGGGSVPRGGVHHVGRAILPELGTYIITARIYSTDLATSRFTARAQGDLNVESNSFFTNNVSGIGEDGVIMTGIINTVDYPSVIDFYVTQNVASSTLQFYSYGQFMRLR